MKRNIPLLKLDYFFGGFWLLAPLIIIYFQQITGSYTLAMLVFSIASFTTILLEVPSGILSDFFGRKKILIISSLLSLFCFILWAIAGEIKSSTLLFLGALLWGASDAFLSGTDEALMFETMEELGEKNNFNSFFASACAFNQFGLALSAIIGGCIVYFTSLQILAWVSILPAFLGLTSICLLKEPNKTSHQTHTPTLKYFKKAFKNITSNKKLFFFSIINIVDNAINYPISRIEGAYFEKLIPYWAISFVRFLKQVCSTISFSFFNKIKKFNTLNILLFSFLGNIIFKSIALFFNNIITPVVISAANLFYGTSTTVQTDILQQNFSKDQRATMRSLISMLEKILTSVLFIFFGFLADLYSAKSALIIAILIRVFLTILIYLYSKNKN